MFAIGKSYRTEQLIDLERTVDFLNRQLRKMQWDLYRGKVAPLPIRFWRNLVNRNGRQKFMSAVCNRCARPNIKMVPHADPRA